MIFRQISKLTLNQKFILQNLFISILLGFFVWFSFYKMFNEESYSIAHENLKNELESNIEFMVSSYQESIRKYEDFQNFAIKKILISTADDFYLIVSQSYQEYMKGRISEKAAKQRIYDILSQRKIGRSGYIYILSNNGTVIYHPKKELIGLNQNINEKKYDFIRFQIENSKNDRDSAYTEYEWKNPGENNLRPKAIGQVYFKPWNWIISASSYKIDFDYVIDPNYRVKLFQDFRNQILKIGVGKKGYPFIVAGENIEVKDVEGNIIDSKKKYEVIIHPNQSLEKKSIQEIDQNLAQKLFEEKEGFVKYQFEKKEKIAVFKYYPDLKWIIAVSAYPDDYFLKNREYLMNMPLKIVLLFLLINISLNIFFFYRNVIRVIKRVRIKLNSVADGDLTIKKSVPKTNDNIGLMLLSINNMVTNLEQIIKNILSSSTDIYKSIEEVSSGNSDLSLRTEKQAVSLEELAASIEEFTSIVKSNVINADKANRLSQEAKLSAEKGGGIVFEAVSTMQKVEQSSFEIENINNIIEEIAFQTNLLALNASVEAARAGENGRGFAVVAIEIRNLARKTSVFAKQISQLIKNTVENIEKGNRLVNQSGEALQNIIDIITNTTNLISEVYAGSEEQIKGIEEINKAMLQLEEINNQNARLAEKVSSTSEEMLGKMIVLRSIIKYFNIRKELLEEVKVSRKDVIVQLDDKNNADYQDLQNQKVSEFTHKDFEEF